MDGGLGKGARTVQASSEQRLWGRGRSHDRQERAV